MMENYKVNTWETMHYYETVTVDKCKSAFLDNNEEYQGMITMIEMFNAEVTVFSSSGSKCLVKECSNT